MTIGPRSPLEHRAADLARLAQATGGAVSLAEVTGLAQIDLRVDPAEAGRLPFALPLEPNTLDQGERVAALWLGPDEWLLVAGDEDPRALVGAIDGALDGVHRSVVDVSANRAVLDLAGRDRLEVLSMGCGLDLHPRSWRAGLCAQTLLANTQVLLQEREDRTRTFIRPSFAEHLVDRLLDATANGGDR